MLAAQPRLCDRLQYEDGNQAALELQGHLSKIAAVRDDAITGADLSRPPLTELYREHLLELARQEERCHEEDGGLIGPESGRFYYTRPDVESSMPAWQGGVKFTSTYSVLAMLADDRFPTSSEADAIWYRSAMVYGPRTGGNHRLLAGALFGVTMPVTDVLVVDDAYDARDAQAWEEAERVCRRHGVRLLTRGARDESEIVREFCGLAHDVQGFSTGLGIILASELLDEAVRSRRRRWRRRSRR